MQKMPKITKATAKVLADCAPKRMKFGHKTSNGTVCIIAGGKDYHGAAVLAGNAVCNVIAALRVGIGYATLYVPASLQNACRKLSPNCIVKQIGKNTIGQGNISVLKKDILKSNCIAIGMGMGRDKQTLKKTALIADYAISHDKKIIIDGDALYAVHYMKKLNQNVLLTPHDKEFEELTGNMPKLEDTKNRQALACNLAKKLNCDVLLKGHDTLVCNANKTVLISSKSATLATMGTGDVLSGIIAGYAASGAEMLEAAAAGAYLHAKIGDNLNSSMGNHAIASDIVAAIPKILKKYDC